MPTTSLTSPYPLGAIFYSKGLELGTGAMVEGHWLTEIVRNNDVHRYSISLKRNSLASFLFSKASMINQMRSDYFICS